MVGLGRVAGGWADAAVFFSDQVFARELLGAAEAPGIADFGVKILGKRFGQSVGESFCQDRIVIVVLAVEALGEFIGADAGGDGKRADVILSPALDGRDKVGK